MCDSILQYAFADGQFPDGSILPEPFRGITRIDQNSYINPDETYKIKGPISVSVESARALLESGNKLLQDVADTNNSSRQAESAYAAAQKQAASVSGKSVKEDVRARSTSKDNVSPAYSISEDDDGMKMYADDNMVSAEIEAETAEFLSGSSDEDEEPDGIDIAADADDDESVVNDPQRVGSQSDVGDDLGGDDEDFEDSVIEAEDGAELGNEMDGYRGSELRSLSAPLEEGRGIASSPIVAKGVKSRTKLRALLDDKDYNIAGPIGSQRVTDGIAMIPRASSTAEPLENM